MFFVFMNRNKTMLSDATSDELHHRSGSLGYKGIECRVDQSSFCILNLPKKVLCAHDCCSISNWPLK